MIDHSLWNWSVSHAAGAASLGLNFLVHSTLIIAAGVIAAALLRRRSAVMQSLILRAMLVAVLLCPLASLLLVRAGFTGLRINLPAIHARTAIGEEAPTASEPVLPSSDEFASQDAPDFVGSAPRTVSSGSQPTVRGADPTSKIGGAHRFTPGTSDSEAPDSPHFPAEHALSGPSPEARSRRESMHSAGAAATAIEAISHADAAPAIIAQITPGPVPAVIEPDPQTRPSKRSPMELVYILLATIWIVVTALLLTRLALAIRLLRRVRRAAKSASCHWIEDAGRCARVIGVHTPPILATHYFKTPCLVGCQHPVILLPADAKSVRHDVLLHELAHLRRNDCLWHLLAHAVTALLWCQPLMWLLARRIERAADEVCDDFVVAYGSDRAEYAHALVDMAERHQTTWVGTGCAVGMAGFKSSVGKRVVRIMDNKRAISIGSRRLTALMILVLCAAGTILTAMLGTNIPVAAADAAAQPAAPRIAVPDAASQAKKEKLVRDVFGNYLTSPATERSAIAAKMIDASAGSGDDQVARFVLLKDAADLAASVGDAPTAMHAASILAATYAIDGGEFKYSLLRKSATVATGLTTNPAKGVVDEGLTLANEAVAAGNYDLASRLMTPTEQAARNAHSAPLMQAVQARVAEIRWMQGEATRAKSAEEKLAKTPDDPEANLSLGRFFCFVKGDWKGLHGLAKGANPGFKAAALADLANPTATDKQVAVGDLWWELAEKEKEAPQKAMKRRAGYWYSQAAANPQFGGLGRALVEKRLAQVPAGEIASAPNQQPPATPAPNPTASQTPSRNPTPSSSVSNEMAEFARHRSTLPPDRQLPAIIERLKELNNGAQVLAEIRSRRDGTSELDIVNQNKVINIEPIYGLQVSKLNLSGCGKLRTLNGVQGLPLTQLNLSHCESLEGDLSLLNGMQLTQLNLKGCKNLKNLNGLQGMPLKNVEVPAHLAKGNIKVIVDAFPTIETLNTNDQQLDNEALAAIKARKGSPTVASKPPPAGNIFTDTPTPSPTLSVGRSILLFRGHAEETRIFHEIARGGNVEHADMDPDPIAVLANPNCFTKVSIVAFGGNQIHNLPGAAFSDDVKRRLRQFVENGGDLITFGNGEPIERMQFLNTLFGLRAIGGEYHGAVMQTPDLLAAMHAAGLSDHALGDLVCITGFEPPASAKILMRASHASGDIPIAGILPFGKGRVIFFGNGMGKVNVPFGEACLRYVYGNSSAVPAASSNGVLTNSIGMKLVSIPAGEFMMGSPETEAGRFNGETLHRVKISRPFLMATTPVTQAQWKGVIGTNPSFFRGSPEGSTTPRSKDFTGKEDDLPVEQVSWNDAVKFCEMLSAKEGKHYRLPSEAEWEYACRAGTRAAFGDGTLDDVAWYDANSGKQSHDVATKKPNRWGLYDMIGNVWQWCSDGWAPYAGDAVDPKGSDDTSFRVMRGGSWVFPPSNCRAAMRRKFAPVNRNHDVGFRIVMENAGDAPAGASLDLTTVEPAAAQVGFARLGVNEAPSFVDHLPKLNGQPATRYFFAHAPSKITFAASTFGGKTFVSKGIVTHPATHGVIFIVAADGKEIFRSKLAKHNEVIDIEAKIPAEARTLDLIADADGVSTSAWAFWVHPAIAADTSAQAPASGAPTPDSASAPPSGGNIFTDGPGANYPQASAIPVSRVVGNTFARRGDRSFVYEDKRPLTPTLSRSTGRGSKKAYAITGALCSNNCGFFEGIDSRRVRASARPRILQRGAEESGASLSLVPGVNRCKKAELKN